MMFIAPSTVFQCWTGYVDPDYYIKAKAYGAPATPWSGNICPRGIATSAFRMTTIDVLTQLLLIE